MNDRLTSVISEVRLSQTDIINQFGQIEQSRREIENRLAGTDTRLVRALDQIRANRRAAEKSAQQMAGQIDEIRRLIENLGPQSQQQQPHRNQPENSHSNRPATNGIPLDSSLPTESTAGTNHQLAKQLQIEHVQLTETTTRVTTPIATTRGVLAESTTDIGYETVVKPTTTTDRTTTIVTPATAARATAARATAAIEDPLWKITKTTTIAVHQFIAEMTAVIAQMTLVATTITAGTTPGIHVATTTIVEITPVTRAIATIVETTTTSGDTTADTTDTTTSSTLRNSGGRTSSVERTTFQP